MTRFRDHLGALGFKYRQMVEADRFDELDRELAAERWAEGEDTPPIAPSIFHKASEIMAYLHAAAKNQDKQAARAALDRLHRWLNNIAV